MTMEIHYLIGRVWEVKQKGQGSAPVTHTQNKCLTYRNICHNKLQLLLILTSPYKTALYINTEN